MNLGLSTKSISYSKFFKQPRPSKMFVSVGISSTRTIRPVILQLCFPTCVFATISPITLIFSTLYVTTRFFYAIMDASTFSGSHFGMTSHWVLLSSLPLTVTFTSKPVFLKNHIRVRAFILDRIDVKFFLVAHLIIGFDCVYLRWGFRSVRSFPTRMGKEAFAFPLFATLHGYRACYGPVLLFAKPTDELV